MGRNSISPSTDFRDALSAVADAAGIATVIFPASQDFETFIDRISVRTNSALISTARVFVGSVSFSNQQDATTLGNENIADESSGIWVPAGSDLIIQWTGATVGAVCTAAIQGRYISEEIEGQSIADAIAASRGGLDSWLWPEIGFPNQSLQQSSRRGR